MYKDFEKYFEDIREDVKKAVESNTEALDAFMNQFDGYRVGIEDIHDKIVNYDVAQGIDEHLREKIDVLKEYSESLGDVLSNVKDGLYSMEEDIDKISEIKEGLLNSKDISIDELRSSFSFTDNFEQAMRTVKKGLDVQYDVFRESLSRYSKELDKLDVLEESNKKLHEMKEFIDNLIKEKFEKN